MMARPRHLYLRPGGRRPCLPRTSSSREGPTAARQEPPAAAAARRLPRAPRDPARLAHLDPRLLRPAQARRREVRPPAGLHVRARVQCRATLILGSLYSRWARPRRPAGPRHPPRHPEGLLPSPWGRRAFELDQGERPPRAVGTRVPRARRRAGRSHPVPSRHGGASVRGATGTWSSCSVRPTASARFGF